MHNIHHTAYQSSMDTELRLANIEFNSQVLLKVALQKIPPILPATIKSTSQLNHVLAININRMIYHVHMPLLLYYILTIYSLLSFYHNFIQFKPDKIPTLQIFILLYSVRMYYHQNLIPIQRKNLHAMFLYFCISMVTVVAVAVWLYRCDIIELFARAVVYIVKLYPWH